MEENYQSFILGHTSPSNFSFPLDPSFFKPSTNSSSTSFAGAIISAPIEIPHISNLPWEICVELLPTLTSHQLHIFPPCTTLMICPPPLVIFLLQTIYTHHYKLFQHTIDSFFNYKQDSQQCKLFSYPIKSLPKPKALHPQH